MDATDAPVTTASFRLPICPFRPSRAVDTQVCSEIEAVCGMRVHVVIQWLVSATSARQGSAQRHRIHRWKRTQRQEPSYSDDIACQPAASSAIILLYVTVGSCQWEFIEKSPQNKHIWKHIELLVFFWAGRLADASQNNRCRDSPGQP